MSSVVLTVTLSVSKDSISSEVILMRVSILVSSVVVMNFAESPFCKGATACATASTSRRSRSTGIGAGGRSAVVSRAQPPEALAANRAPPGESRSGADHPTTSTERASRERDMPNKRLPIEVPEGFIVDVSEHASESVDEDAGVCSLDVDRRLLVGHDHLDRLLRDEPDLLAVVLDIQPHGGLLVFCGMTDLVFLLMLGVSVLRTRASRPLPTVSAEQPLFGP
jgi:hypothetical protein